jgi:hypothetical protein
MLNNIIQVLESINAMAEITAQLDSDQILPTSITNTSQLYSLMTSSEFLFVITLCNHACTSLATHHLTYRAKKHGHLTCQNQRDH